MYLKNTYEQEFDDLYMHLRSKYPQSLFDLDGIGEQTDMSKFSKNFFSSKVTADASVDANANVDDVSVIAYSTELPKPWFKLNSYYILWKELKKAYGLEVANNIIEMQLTGDIYVHDFHGIGAGMPYCFNYSTYDIMTQGLSMVKKISSKPPKYLYSFKSQLEQFTVLASNSTLGATGLADMLLVMSWYVSNIFKTGHDAGFYMDGWFSDDEKDLIEKDLCGLEEMISEENIDEDAIEKLTNKINNKLNKRTPRHQKWFKSNVMKYVRENLVSFIYTVNQPMRANQSPFTNVSIYDDLFLDKMYDDYIFPDGSLMDLELVREIQIMFLDIMNKEQRRTPITFPVTTACFSVDANNEIQDNKFLKMISKKNMEFGFINLYCGKTSTLSSCCRLRSESQNEYFNSFGSGSSKIGSLGVVSINFPRLALKNKDNKEEFLNQIEGMVEVCGKINHSKRKIVQKRINNGNHPLYTLGFMDLIKQYSTVGVNGFNEALEILGYDILTKEGQDFGLEIINAINKANDKMQKRFSAPHNCEQVPAENMSIKIATKDKLLKYQNTYDIYSNQFIPLVVNADLLDRIKLQGLFDSHFSGGAIAHLNVDTKITDQTKIENLIKASAKAGVIYFAINYNIQQCENGHMSVGRGKTCSICGSKITDNYIRVVGFLTNTKNWHKIRREQDYPNRKFYGGI